jgi:hypothetical protein
MDAPISVTDQALAAFIKYARRERNIDRTEAMLKAVYTNSAQAANIQLARIANLTSLHLESKSRSRL